jgi:hypothetical protein
MRSELDSEDPGGRSPRLQHEHRHDDDVWCAGVPAHHPPVAVDVVVGTCAHACRRAMQLQGLLFFSFCEGSLFAVYPAVGQSARHVRVKARAIRVALAVPHVVPAPFRAGRVRLETPYCVLLPSPEQFSTTSRAVRDTVRKNE